MDVKFVRYAREGGGKLPKGYTELPYIESTDTQYINTGYNATSENYRIKCKFAITDYAENEVLFGGGASTDIVSALITSDGKLKFYVGSGSVSGVLVPFVTGTEYEMECHANNGIFTVTINGTSYSGTYSGAINKDYPLFIFANNSSGVALQISSVRISEFQIYDNGTLVRDYVSCGNANGEIGLHDVANNVFYGNAGSGEFYSPFQVDESPALLWTNASPTSAFAAQTIAVRAHSTYLILWKVTSYTGSSTVTNQNVYLWSYLNADMNGKWIYYPYYDTITNYMAGRSVSYSGGAITFSTGMGVNSPNYYFIPVKIYGCGFSVQQ